MHFEEVVLLFTRTMASLPDAKLHSDFDITNICEIDEVTYYLLAEDKYPADIVNLAAHSARVLLRAGFEPLG